MLNCNEYFFWCLYLYLLRNEFFQLRLRHHTSVKQDIRPARHLLFTLYETESNTLKQTFH